jgi:hypothetical protein
VDPTAGLRTRIKTRHRDTEIRSRIGSTALACEAGQLRGRDRRRGRIAASVQCDSPSPAIAATRAAARRAVEPIGVRVLCQPAVGSRLFFVPS